MRDFYDIYLIYTKEQDSIKIDILKEAIERTFRKRNYNKPVLDTLKIIENSEVLKIRWNSYRNKYSYAKTIEYDEIMKCINVLFKKLREI